MTARSVSPEILDQLPHEDPRAKKARKDLQLINFLMGNARYIARRIKLSGSELSPTSIVDIGCGDGSLALSILRHLPQPKAGSSIMLVDQIDCIPSTTLESMSQLGWESTIRTSDAEAALASLPESSSTVVIANLFLHHLEKQTLQSLLRKASDTADLFVAVEPRRSRGPLFATSLLGAIGCNNITRHDAAVSVHAGFRDGELSDLWPEPDGWELSEHKSGLFSHLFAAQKSATLPPT